MPSKKAKRSEASLAAQQTIRRRFGAPSMASIVRGLTRSEMQQPVGAREIATLLGVRPATVQQWKFRQVLPPAELTVNGRDAWRLRTVVEWAANSDRIPAKGITLPRQGAE